MKSMAIVTELANLRQLSVGPEAALSLLVGQVITQLTMSDPHSIPEHPEKIAIAIALMITLQVRSVHFVWDSALMYENA